jgi:4-hydroxyphenylpyruvate dioxygenase
MQYSNEEEIGLSTNGERVQAKKIDYIELYVGNASQAAYYYRNALGFTPTALVGLETGIKDRSSILVQQKDARLVLSSTLRPDDELCEHLKLHGDSVKDIAFEVSDAKSAFERAVAIGATPVIEPTVIEDEMGRVIKATVGGCGALVHSLIQREGYKGIFLPGYRDINPLNAARATSLNDIDHVAICVEKGELAEWVEFYCRVFGFHESHQEDVSTEYSAMNSKVVQNGNSKVVFPLLEPAEGKRKSQIEEYLMLNHGPGVQHLAFLSDDILFSVRALRENGLDFLHVPTNYYDSLDDRVGNFDANISALRDLFILADRDHFGHLLQIFTKPIQSRPTFFLEVIQRLGARGFGGGNIRALFEAVEREQSLRGNL